MADTPSEEEGTTAAAGTVPVAADVFSDGDTDREIGGEAIDALAEPLPVVPKRRGRPRKSKAEKRQTAKAARQRRAQREAALEAAARLAQVELPKANKSPDVTKSVQEPAPVAAAASAPPVELDEKMLRRMVGRTWEGIYSGLQRFGWIDAAPIKDDERDILTDASLLLSGELLQNPDNAKWVAAFNIVQVLGARVLANMANAGKPQDAAAEPSPQPTSAVASAEPGGVSSYPMAASAGEPKPRERTTQPVRPVVREKGAGPGE